MLLEISQARTNKLTPTDILKNYRSNRFAAPSLIDPARLYQLAVDITRKAKENGIEPVLLSPVAPLGSCSVFGCVDQNYVVSATRGCEVLSDTSNMLAIYLADKISSGEIGNKNSIHVCSIDRLTRAQVFKGARSFAHFGIFCIVSSGKDTGSYSCEMGLLTKQLSFYREFFKAGYEADMAVVLRKRGGYTGADGFFAKMLHLMQQQLPDVPVRTDDSDMRNNYYQGINNNYYQGINKV
ncbi:MAG: hypothetical protein ACOX8W_01850 [bacterium]